MLDLVLYGPEGPQPVGRPAPIQVEVRNTGAREVWIAGVLDGSEAGLRYPHYLPSVTLAGSGRTVARARAGRGSARRAAADGRPAPTDAWGILRPHGRGPPAALADLRSPNPRPLRLCAHALHRGRASRGVAERFRAAVRDRAEGAAGPGRAGAAGHRTGRSGGGGVPPGLRGRPTPGSGRARIGSAPHCRSSGPAIRGTGGGTSHGLLRHRRRRGRMQHRAGRGGPPDAGFAVRSRVGEGAGIPEAEASGATAGRQVGVGEQSCGLQPDALVEERLGAHARGGSRRLGP